MTEHFLTSEMLRLACPSVIVLNQFCKVPRLHDKKQAPRYPSRVAILMRDDSTCQYCSAVATTVDHVVPRSKGGGQDWGNLVACCSPCNAKKGNRLLSQTAMKLMKQPRTPTSMEIASWLAKGETNDKKKLPGKGLLKSQRERLAKTVWEK